MAWPNRCANCPVATGVVCTRDCADFDFSDEGLAKTERKHEVRRIKEGLTHAYQQQQIHYGLLDALVHIIDTLEELRERR